MKEVLNLLKEILLELRKSDDKNKDKLTLTLRECSQISGIGLNTLLIEVNSSQSNFPFFRVGKKVLVNKQMFYKWLDNVAKEHKELKTG